MCIQFVFDFTLIIFYLYFNCTWFVFYLYSSCIPFVLHFYKFSFHLNRIPVVCHIIVFIFLCIFTYISFVFINISFGLSIILWFAFHFDIFYSYSVLLYLYSISVLFVFHLYPFTFCGREGILTEDILAEDILRVDILSPRLRFLARWPTTLPPPSASLHNLTWFSLFPTVPSNAHGEQSWRVVWTLWVPLKNLHASVNICRHL